MGEAIVVLKNATIVFFKLSLPSCHRQGNGKAKLARGKQIGLITLSRLFFVFLVKRNLFLKEREVLLGALGVC